MRRRSFRVERDFPQLRPRSSWANLSQLVKKVRSAVAKVCTS